MPTLLAHGAQWPTESEPLSRALPRLDRDEAESYDAVRNMTLGRNVRLEQEMIEMANCSAACVDVGRSIVSLIVSRNCQNCDFSL